MSEKETAGHTSNVGTASRSSLAQRQDKDNKIPLSYHQRRVVCLLAQGGQYSAADISVALHLSDPRSVIRDLRAKGVIILDVWCDAVHGGRFKRYFLRKEGGRNE